MPTVVWFCVRANSRLILNEWKKCDGWGRVWSSWKEEKEVILNGTLTAWKATGWFGHDNVNKYTFISVVTVDSAPLDLSNWEPGSHGSYTSS